MTIGAKAKAPGQPIQVRTVRQLKGACPRTKLHHLYKTVCRRGIGIYLTKEDILVTPGVMAVLLQRRSEDLDKGDSQALRVLLSLRYDREASSCLEPVSAAFRQKTRDMETTVRLFYLLADTAR